MKIAFLRVDDFGRGMDTNVGGGYSHATGMVNALRKAGHEVFFMASAWPLIGEPENGSFYPIPYERFPSIIPEAWRIFYNYRFVRQALPILRKEKPDFLYQRHSDFNCSGALLAKWLNIPLILEANASEVWVRENWGTLHFKYLAHLFEDTAFAGASIITVVSKILKQQLIELGVPACKIVVNPNGVDPRRFHPNIDGGAIRQKYNLQNRIVVGFVGTFGVWHGIPVLAEAIGPVIHQNSSIHFFLIGDGALKPEMKIKVEKEGLSEFVTFVGSILHDEVPTYLAACDILVSPHVPLQGNTPFFGSPTKLFEYMAMGKGIVASALGQIDDILHNGKNAITTEPGNKDELIAGIVKLAENPTLRAALGQQAYQDVLSEYTWDRNAQRVVEAYQQLNNRV
jgi:glycosyltransferase involved in cell wall biosynthesis